MPSEQQNRELKAARIEQLLVEAGYTRVTEQSRAAARRAGIKASQETWDTVKRFLVDRFPNG